MLLPSHKCIHANHHSICNPGIIGGTIDMTADLARTMTGTTTGLARTTTNMVPDLVCSMRPSLMCSTADMTPELVLGTIDMMSGLVSGIIGMTPDLAHSTRETRRVRLTMNLQSRDSLSTFCTAHARYAWDHVCRLRVRMHVCMCLTLSATSIHRKPISLQPY